MSILNSDLARRSYLIGNSFTLADACVAESVIGLKLTKYPEVIRWVLHVIAFCPGATLPESLLPQSSSPLVFPLILKREEPSKNMTSKEAASSGGAEESKVGGAEAGQQDTDGKNKKEGKKAKIKLADNKETTVAAPTSTGSEELDPSKLDFRVGRVVKCWDHPEAEKLLCEEIDCGESSGPRQIASGLRAHYHAEEMQGRKVIVLANLKDRNLVGFKSQVGSSSIIDIEIRSRGNREW